MKISTSIICTLAMSSIAFADEAFVTKIVRVRGDAMQLAILGCAPQASCKPSPALRAIVINGTGANVAKAEQNITELDSLAATVDPSTKKNIESVFYVITGSSQALPGLQDVSGDALTPVVRQLRSIFPYSHFQLLSTMLLRSAEDAGAMTQGLMPGLGSAGQGSRPSQYGLSYESLKYSPGTSSIHIKNFQFKASVSVPELNGNLYKMSDVGVSSYIDIREGQKVVVGKANLADSDTCFFIVVSSRLVP